MILKKIIRISMVVRRYGFRHTLGLIRILFIIPLQVRLLHANLGQFERVQALLKKRWAGRVLDSLASRKADFLGKSPSPYTASVQCLGLSAGDLEDLPKERGKRDTVILGRFDQDGFLLPASRKIRGLPTVSEKNFLPRKRFKLELVAIEGRLYIKKQYQSDKEAFLNEITALHKLRRYGCNVPSLLDIDFDTLTLTVSYIPGQVLREALARAGAVIRDCDVDSPAENCGPSSVQLWERRIQEGRALLGRVVDDAFIRNLFLQVKRAHGAGVIINDIKYGNIIIEKDTGIPFLIDFDRSLSFSNPTAKRFLLMRDRDIQMFNLLFGTRHLTFRSIQDKLRKMAGQPVYAPAYLGLGMRLGHIGNERVGYGRWHYILKDNLPGIKNKRILDLGANNAHNALQLLRGGARQVIGVELDEAAMAQGRFIHETYEWADNTGYDFSYLHTSMAQLPDMDLGRFDIVMALCSIYYLQESEILRVAEHVRGISDRFILQANTEKDISRKNPETYRKASLDYAVHIMESCGFTIEKIVSPPGYTRPLVIGKS